MDFSHLGFVPKFLCQKKLAQLFWHRFVPILFFFKKMAQIIFVNLNYPTFLWQLFLWQKKIATNFSAAVLWQV